MDFQAIAERVRADYGTELPASQVRESAADRQLRQEKTKYVLERDIMPRLNDARVQRGEQRLSPEDEDTVIALILSSMFLLPAIQTIFDGEPLAEDLTITGASQVRVDRADGTVGFYPPVVQKDRDLERVIGDVAEQHQRPFSFEQPFVDLALNSKMRFHGEGFDVVSAPAIFIRVHRVLGATIEDLAASGTMSAGLAYLLGTVVPKAGLKVAVCGDMGSGKTTLLRALCLAYPEDTRMQTIETDPELQIKALGRPWCHEMHARIAVTSSARGIDCADLMTPALRTSSKVTVIGEVRGGEGAAAVRAANIGSGTMVTVHGDTAEAGLEQLVDRLAESGTPREVGYRMVYKSFDLVVHCQRSPNRDRWVGEVIAPTTEGDQPKVHTLYAPSATADDVRARATQPGWPQLLLNKIRMTMPDFDEHRARDDHYEPLNQGAAHSDPRATTEDWPAPPQNAAMNGTHR